MNTKTINFKGYTMTCYDFIVALDNCRITMDRKVGYSKSHKYCEMICVLQELMDDFDHGEITLRDELQDWLERHDYIMPKNREMIPAIEELFDQMQNKMMIGLDFILEYAADRSKQTIARMTEESRLLKERKEKVHNMIMAADLGGFPKSSSGLRQVEQITWILNLHLAKQNNPDYEIKEEEMEATKLWCDLLTMDICQEKLTYGMMLRIVNHEIMTESDIEEFLKEAGEMNDFEYYSEGFIGEYSDVQTCLKVKSILAKCEETFMEKLYITD